MIPPAIPTPIAADSKRTRGMACLRVCGDPEVNPHALTGDEQAWRCAYERWILVLSAGVDIEGGA